MVIGARLGGLVLLSALISCGSGAEDGNRRILHAHNLMRHAGFGALGPVTGGELQLGGSRTITTALGGGRCHIMAVMGVPELLDVDIVVTDPNGESLAEDATVGPNAVVSFCTEDDGDHDVTVTAEQGSGAFHLAYWIATGRGGGGQRQASPGGNVLTLGRPMNGFLPRDRPHMDYTFQLQESRFVTVDLMSDDFDAYLILLERGMVIDENDDGGSDLNSRISLHLMPGSYTVRVSSFMESGDGQFTVTVR